MLSLVFVDDDPGVCMLVLVTCSIAGEEKIISSRREQISRGGKEQISRDGKGAPKSFLSDFC
jgi:hypothetical protein